MARTIALLFAALSLNAAAAPKKRAPPRGPHRVEICGPIIKPRGAVIVLYERKPPELPDSLVTVPKRFTPDTW